jgi:hypothetical protein
MKPFITVAFLCLLAVIGCKKSPQIRVISIATTNISSYTMYTIIVKNTRTGTTPLDISTLDGRGNQTFFINAQKGDVLNMQYAMYTQGTQYGQGFLDVTCNGQSLWHSNGGSGQNIILTTP